jgi:hypothetical protein
LQRECCERRGEVQQPAASGPCVPGGDGQKTQAEPLGLPAACLVLARARVWI